MNDRPLHQRRIHLATDHAGFVLKESVKEWLLSEHLNVIDHGACSFDADDDFPDYINQAALAVSQQPAQDCAIIFGGSGQGEAINANRYQMVRACVYYGGEETIVPLSRQHNDSNVLSLGARFVDSDTAKRVIWVWLHEAPLKDLKYWRRNQKIERLTKESSL